jgi:uncharacterized protein (TIGR03067 family)
MSRFLVLASLVALVFTSHIGAQSPDASTVLQGRWVVTAAEHQGKPFDAIKGGVMTIAGDAFEVRTASGNLLKGTLRIDASKAPSQMDMMHADGARWEAIYVVEGDTFRLNYVEADGKETRPVTFTTNDATEATVIVLRRESR